MVRLPQNENQTYQLNSKASNVTIRFDLSHDLDLEFSRSNMEFPMSQPKVVRLPRNEKQTFRLTFRAEMWPMGLTLTITLTFEFWRSNVTLTFDRAWSWPWIFMVKFWNSCISDWEGRLILHKRGGSRSFMTMTIWWPRSGVWIYHIVTGMTSVVGVPSTHLVVFIETWKFNICLWILPWPWIFLVTCRTREMICRYSVLFLSSNRCPQFYFKSCLYDLKDFSQGQKLLHLRHLPILFTIYAKYRKNPFTHLSLVPHLCIGALDRHWFR